MLKHLKNARELIDRERIEAMEAAEANLPYPDIGVYGYDQTTITLFERLIEQPCMDSAWVTLSKILDDDREPPDTCKFANACSKIFKTWSCSPVRTPEEHVNHFISLARDLLSIANRMAVEPEFGALGGMAATLSPTDLIPDKKIQWLIEGLESGLDMDDEARVDLARMYLFEFVPGFSEYARHLGLRAINIAGQLPVRRHAGRATAGRTFFEQSLSLWFVEHLGKSFRGQDVVMGNVASALFPEFEVTSSSDVRKARLRGRRISRA